MPFRKIHFDVTGLDENQLKEKETYKFDLLYQAAKNNDEALIKEILAQGVCINEKINQETPAGKLAREGNTKAARLLMKFGANIQDIVLGASRGGYFEYAEFLQKRYEIDITYIAMGAAMGGYFEHADTLILRGAEVEAVACYAALGGHNSYAKRLCMTNDIEKSFIVGAAAEGGDFDYIDKMPCNQDFAVIIARSAARGGHFGYAEKFIKKVGPNVIAWGALKGGYCRYAEKLRLTHQLNTDFYAVSVAQYGHFDYAEHLRLTTETSLPYFKQGACEGYHMDYVEYLHKDAAANLTDWVIPISLPLLL